MTSSRLFLNLQRYGAGIGAGLVLFCAAVEFVQPKDFFAGYLSAFLFWVQLALGSLGLLLLQYLTGGRWGAAITRLLEAGALTLPALAVLFLPIIFGMSYLFPWVHPEGTELRHLVEQKVLYLNVPFYLARFVIYFTATGALAAWYRRLSLQRQSEDVATLEKWSGPALILFVLLTNFATVDWVMSLKPEWYSSMLSVEFGAEEAVATMAWSILVLHWLNRLGQLPHAVEEKITHDLGNLLLGFTCFWTYVTFAEYLIIWTGNLPHEVSWFTDRSTPGWKTVAVVLVVLHFVIPLFCLILTAVSRDLNRLARVAGLLLIAHYVQVIWWVGPASTAHRFPWTSPVLVVALGLIWFALYLRHLRAAPLSLPETESQARTGVPA